MADRVRRPGGYGGAFRGARRTFRDDCGRRRGCGCGRSGDDRARRRLAALSSDSGSSGRRAARRGNGGLNRPIHGRAPAGARARCNRDGQNDPESRRKPSHRGEMTRFCQLSAPKKKTPTGRRRCLAVGVISPSWGGSNGGRTPSPIPDRREPATSGYTDFIGRKTRPLDTILPIADGSPRPGTRTGFSALRRRGR